MGAHHNVKPLRGNPNLLSPLHRAKENSYHPQLFPIQINRHRLGRMWCIDHRVQHINDDSLRL